MKITRIAQLGAVAAIAALTLTSCAANEGDAPTASGGATDGASLSGTLNATGASSQDAAEQAWVAGFQTANGGVTVNYQATGSGVGRDNFKGGTSQFIGSDRAFHLEEIEEGGFGSCADDGADGIVEVPVYISPVAIIFNLEGVDTLNLSASTVAKIFNGDITSWDDPEIADANPDAELPSTAISPVHRSDTSGTSEVFTTYLSAAGEGAWTHEPSDEWPINAGEAAQGTAGVVSAVTGGNGTIGYADASQAGDLGTVAVEVDGEYVAYSAEAAAALVDSSPLEDGRADGDLVFDVDPASATGGAYPIALVSYLVACKSYEDENVGTLVREYLTYVASAEGQDVAAEAAGSAPISDSLREQVQAAIDLIG